MVHNRCGARTLLHGLRLSSAGCERRRRVRRLSVPHELRAVSVGRAMSSVESARFILIVAITVAERAT